jgi:hypothetical protein
MVAPTCFGITFSSSGSVPSAFWEILTWGAVDRILSTPKSVIFPFPLRTTSCFTCSSSDPFYLSFNNFFCMNYFLRQVQCQMWPVQLPLLRFSVCTIFFPSWLLVILVILHISQDTSKLIAGIKVLNYTVRKLPHPVRYCVILFTYGFPSPSCQ